MIKLSQFVAETLKEVVEGVREAQVASRSIGGRIVPELESSMGYETWDPQSKAPIQKVSFDVAVTTSEGTSTDAQAGVFVTAFKLGASGASEASSSAVSRIQFEVPVALPNDLGVEAYINSKKTKS